MSLLLAYYGDDFTGSTDVMEVLQWAGLRTVLFLQPPTTGQLRQFEGLRAFGVAGWSRTMSPAEMDCELPGAFAALRDSGAALGHYKICSTFDSSPDIGSIGRAMEIGREIFGPSPIPILVGAPALGRFTVFGNLFARSGLDSEPFRLDRHPTMQQHPITPMDESDLRRILARQTRLKVALLDVLNLEQSKLTALLQSRPDAILFDALDPAQMERIGGMLEEMGPFVVGSSGVEYALVAHLRAQGKIGPEFRPSAAPVDQLLVVSGSCSPVNERQIEWASRIGFLEQPLDTARLVDPETRELAADQAVLKALAVTENGASLILHACRGPEDPRIAETAESFRKLGFDEGDIKLKSSRILGPMLGRILKQILKRKKFQRVAVAGGDTSGYVARELGIEALEAIAPVAPGSPLCRAHAKKLDGLEIIFKGGQVGRADFYGSILRGPNPPATEELCHRSQ